MNPSATLLLTLASLGSPQGGLPGDEPPPNLVFILADDMGWGDARCYRADSKIPTPHIDRLAAGGMRFTDAHSASAVCTPTRYAILTGRYCWRTRLERGVLWTYAMPLIEAGRPTVASLLRGRGYATACIGKWHLGMEWARKDGARSPPDTNRLADELIDLTKPVTAGPLTAGFGTYFGTAVPNFPPYCFLENDRILGPIPDRPKPESMFGQAGRMQEGWKLERILPALGERAVSHIEERVRTEPRRPFFLYLPLTAPHTPIVPSKLYQGKSEAGDYGDFVHEVDAVVGAVTAALERLGIAERTLVFFTSDNGSPARAGDPHVRDAKWAATGAVTRMFGHDPNAPWRGMKSDIYEGGHRVPFIVRWPGRVPAGTVCSEPIGSVDVMATVAALLAIPLPEGAAEDSRDISPLLEGGKLPSPSVLIHHSHRGMFAVRQGRWKLILGRGSGGWTRVETSEDDPPGQLYDLVVDPGETKNLYTDHPEIVKRLTALLQSRRGD